MPLQNQDGVVAADYAPSQILYGKEDYFVAAALTDIKKDYVREIHIPFKKSDTVKLSSISSARRKKEDSPAHHFEKALQLHRDFKENHLSELIRRGQPLSVLDDGKPTAFGYLADAWESFRKSARTKAYRDAELKRKDCARRIDQLFLPYENEVNRIQQALYRGYGEKARRRELEKDDKAQHDLGIRLRVEMGKPGVLQHLPEEERRLRIKEELEATELEKIADPFEEVDPSLYESKMKELISDGRLPRLPMDEMTQVAEVQSLATALRKWKEKVREHVEAILPLEDIGIGTYFVEFMINIYRAYNHEKFRGAHELVQEGGKSGFTSYLLSAVRESQITRVFGVGKTREFKNKGSAEEPMYVVEGIEIRFPGGTSKLYLPKLAKKTPALDTDGNPYSQDETEFHTRIRQELKAFRTEQNIPKLLGRYDLREDIVFRLSENL